MNLRHLRLALIASVLFPPLVRAENPPPIAAGVPLEPAKPKWGWLQAILPKSFQSNPELDMTVFTEVTDEGRNLPPVSPQHPVYYQMDYAGFHARGEMSASRQLPTRGDMEQLLTHVLAVQGYQPAQLPAQPPGLLIVYTWGTHNRVVQLDDDNPQSTQSVTQNILERAQLVGGKKFADELAKVIEDSQNAAASAASASRLPGYTPIMVTDMASPVTVFEEKNPKNQFLLEQALDDCYYVVASAYDYQAAAKGGKKLLWRTRMTVNAQGIAIKQAMPTVVVSAGPYFGKETTESEVISRRVIGEGTVEIGTATVVEGPTPRDPAGKKK